jgi:uncharacterized membrane protein YsdA (DUF1294 family)
MLKNYLLIVNAAAFLLMLADKWKALQKDRRIRENILIASAVIGGSIGTWVGMYLFRHKTKHLKFTLGIPIILAIQILIGMCVHTLM